MRVLIEETYRIVCYLDFISPSCSVCAMCDYSEDCALHETNSGDEIMGVRISGD